MNFEMVMPDKPQSGNQGGARGPNQGTSKPKPITWTQKDASGEKSR